MLYFFTRRLGLQLALVGLVSLLSLVVASRVSGLPPGQSSDAPFSTQPAAATVPVGNTFQVSIRIDASSQPVDTATARINYNAGFLQVVDQAGNPSNTIQPGSILTSETWKDELFNQVTVVGSSGTIVFSAGKGSPGSGGRDATTDFELAVVRFKALAPTSGTNVTFNRVTQPITEALLGGADVTGTTSGAVITITSGAGCSPPGSGNWTITQSCTFTGNALAPANVIVESGVTLTIGQNATLNINFATNHLRIKNGGKVVIKNGGKIN